MNTIFAKIKNLFAPKKEDTVDVRVLQLEIDALRRRARRPIDIINPLYGDPAPTDTDARAVYVAEYSRFHQDYLESKLKHLIALTREELDWSGMKDYSHPEGLPNGMDRRDYDSFLRGTSNAFRLLLEYGEQMKGEAMANEANKK